MIEEMAKRIDTDDVQMETMVGEFKRFFSLLNPADRDIFLEKLTEEIENVKKEQQENSLTTDQKIDILVENKIIPKHIRNAEQIAKEAIATQYAQCFEGKQFIGEQKIDIIEIGKQNEANYIKKETQDFLNVLQQEMQEITKDFDNTNTQEISQEPQVQEQVAEQVIEKTAKVQEPIAQETQTQAQTNENITPLQQVQKEGKELDSLIKEQETTLKEISKETQTFDDKIQQSLDDILQKHKEEFKEMGIYKEHTQGGKTYNLFDDQAILPQEEREKLQKDYDNSPNKAEWQPNIAFDINSFKAKHQESQNFINDFMQEVQEIGGNSKSMEQDKKLNPNTYFTDLADWFEKKKMENKEMPMTKDEFKQEFYEYCKNGMSENEMKILVILANKEPSILSKEHKDMINQGLKYTLSNNNLLDRGLETAINVQLGQNPNTKDAKDFIETATKLEKSDKLIDKKMCEIANAKIAEKIKKSPNVNLNDENNKKLNAIIKNDTAALTKSQSQSKGRGR